MKNYTSGVPVEWTIMRIESALVRAGASNIHKDYDDGHLEAICFTIAHPEMKQKLSVRLPADSKAVYDFMVSRVKKPHRGTMDRIREQANKTAWKIIQDWVEVQISLIEMRQAEFLQVFLPYIWNGKETFYNRLREGQFKLLTGREQ